MNRVRYLLKGWTLSRAVDSATDPSPDGSAVPGASSAREPGASSAREPGTSSAREPGTSSAREPGGAAPALPAHIPATVPGCVHTDLLDAGLIDDPYLDRNEARVQWIGHTDWVYQTRFDHEADGATRVDLVCDGLDTAATVTLNGVPLGSTANMHRAYRFDVGQLLLERDNTLRIRFTSPYRYADSVREQVGARPHAYDAPFPYIRKMACNFGWDWGPELASSGIWQPVKVHSWSVARLAEVRPLVTVDGDTGRVAVHVRVERDGVHDGPLLVEASVAGQTGTVRLPAGEDSGVAEVTVPQPRLWYPRGYGSPHRYPLEVSLRDGTRSDGSTDERSRTEPPTDERPTDERPTDERPTHERPTHERPTHERPTDERPTDGGTGGTVDTWRREIGFRTVTLDTDPDADGRPFTVVINGEKVFVRGMNWIPDDVFPTRVDRERYAVRLDQTCAAGVNYLRIWGGGRYESEDFYDLADELGLMVGQDFLFACAAYPEEEPLASEVAAEAHEQVVRLMPHPSLVMWTGNNENIWGFHDWGWQRELNGATWGLGYYLDVLPRIVATTDPTRPYWPGSPYSGSEDIHPNDPAYGTTHIWDVWNQEDYDHYRDYRPRFVAEFGFQGPPAYATVRRAIHDEPLAPDSPGMLAHQKAEDGNGKLSRGLARHLPHPADPADWRFDDWHWATQLNQARAVRLGIEHFRSLRPLCSGTILWQINDCWPVTSWACVDGDGRLKPVWYAVRHSYADRLVTIQPRDDAPGGLAVVIVNDGSGIWCPDFEVSRSGFDGARRAGHRIRVEVEAGGSATVALPAVVAQPDDPTSELLVADHGYGRAVWFFREDVDLAYPRPAYTISGRVDGDETTVRVTADTLLRDLTLFPDRLDPDASVDEALVTLLPGETATFRVRSTRRLAAEALGTAPVLRCANDLAT